MVFGRSCAAAEYRTIGDAVAAATAGGTVTVCAGTYAESVTVDKRLTLRGQRGAVVDATGQPDGIGVIASHGMDMSANVVALNRIGTNNLRTDYADTSTTGIYLADASPLTITVIGNQIHDDEIGIFTAGDVTVKGATLNLFRHVTTPTSSTPTYGG